MSVRGTKRRERIARLFSLLRGKAGLLVIALGCALFVAGVIAFTPDACAQGTPCDDLERPLPEYPETSDFGERESPCAGCSSFHKGIDIGAPEGTPLQATPGGTCQWINGYGNTYTTPANGAGYKQFYAHLSSCNTNGSLATGHTGLGTGPHLHYGVIDPDGNFVDPHSCSGDGGTAPVGGGGEDGGGETDPDEESDGGGGGGSCVLCGQYGNPGSPCEPKNHGADQGTPLGYTAKDYGNDTDIRGVIRQEHQYTTDHILEEFEDQEEFLVNEKDKKDPKTVWGGYLLPAMMMMTEQLVHTAMDQMLIVGSMIDAKQQLETQTLFEKLSAEAHRDYHPSVDMCVIGTNVRSLASAERNAEYTSFVMSQRSLDRQLGNMNNAAAHGQFNDHCFRLREFRERYCDTRDNNNHLAWICDPEGQGGKVFYKQCLPENAADTNQDGNADTDLNGDGEIDEDDLKQGKEGMTKPTTETVDKDISFSRTVDSARTLDIDFYNQEEQASDDEKDIFALASNLYSHDLIFRMPETTMRHRSAQDELLDMRSVIAKRSVAEHSFNTIVGMKAMAKEEAKEMTYPYMKVILKSLGIGEDSAKAEEELKRFLGERPSYYAQMEVLTKRVFQSPDFFVNLYDETANVSRKGAALQAVGLMQDFDTWNSYLRTEAMLSVILELELLRLHGAVENAMGSMRAGGIKLGK